MTAYDIHAALIVLFRTGSFAYVKEFRAGTGYTETPRYLDAWLMQTHPSKPMLVVGIEIKISRSDWNAEIKRPMKRDPAMRITNEFYFATPAGLVTEEELPAEAGLIEVDELGVASFKVRAPHREFIPTLPFVASLARRAANGN